MKRLVFVIVGIIGIICVLPIHIFGQGMESFVSIGDTSINLNDIEISHGYVLKKYYYRKGVGGEIINIKHTAFVSPKSKFFAVSYDSILLNFDITEPISNYINIFKVDGSPVFSKNFSNVSLSNCLICKNAKLIFLEFGSMETEEIIVLDKVGNIIRAENKINSEVTSSYNNKLILLLTGNDNKMFKIDVYIDGELQSKSLSFFDKKPLISFSSNETIIQIKTSNNYQFYNPELQLIKEISTSEGHIYIFNKGQYYLQKTRGKNPVYKIRNLNTDEIISTKETISYNQVKLPIYFAGIVNRGTDIYYAAYYEDSLVFNFYNINGEFINSDKMENFRGMNNIKFINTQTGYKIQTVDTY